MNKKAVIVGGVAGGTSAAARLRRLDESIEIVLLERGEHISYANCGLPYYVGGVIKDREKLFVVTPGLFRERFNVDVRVNSEVLSIDRAKREITVLDREYGGEYRLPSQRVRGKLKQIGLKGANLNMKGERLCFK